MDNIGNLSSFWWVFHFIWRNFDLFLSCLNVLFFARMFCAKISQINKLLMFSHALRKHFFWNFERQNERIGIWIWIFTIYLLYKELHSVSVGPIEIQWSQVMPTILSYHNVIYKQCEWSMCVRRKGGANNVIYISTRYEYNTVINPMELEFLSSYYLLFQRKFVATHIIDRIIRILSNTKGPGWN